MEPRPDGGIGRRGGFKIRFRKKWEFESPSGHHLAVPASLLQDSQHRKTGPRAGFFVPDDLPLPALCVASLYPHLYPEKNNELWDTRIKLPPGENRLIKLK